MRRLTRTALTLVALLLPVSGAAQPAANCAAFATPATGMSAAASISVLYRINCLGGEQDMDPETREAFMKLPEAAFKEAGTASSPVETALIAASVLDTARRELASSPQAVTAFPQALQAIDAATAAIRAGVAPARAALLESGYWRWNPAGEGFEGLPVDLKARLSGCTGTPDAACLAEYQLAAVVIRAATIAERAVNYYRRPVASIALADALRRDARWTAYFEEAPSQFPWELALNSLRFSRHARSRQGFVDTPNDQWILLHPRAGFEFVNTAPKGNKLNPAIAVEVVGYNRWTWDDARPARAIGASFVISVSDIADKDVIGYGALVRIAHKYSASVIWRNGRPGLLVGADLAQWLQTTSAKARSAMRAAGTKLQ